MLSKKQSILLLILAGEQSVTRNQLTADQNEVCTSLIQKSYVREDDGQLRLTNIGQTSVQVFQSGMSFDVLLSRLSNRHLTKLFDKLLVEGKKRNLHWNVVLQNISDEVFNHLSEELEITIKNREEIVAKTATA